MQEKREIKRQATLMHVAKRNKERVGQSTLIEFPQTSMNASPCKHP
jgi:hypothetical protein